MEKSTHTIDLILKFLDHNLSAAEELQLDQWRKKDADNEAAYQELADKKRLAVLLEQEESQRRIWERLEQKFPELAEPKPGLNSIKKFILVAIIAIILGIAGFFFLKSPKKINNPAPALIAVPTIPPAVLKASIAFPTGEKVDIEGTEDSAGNFQFEGKISADGGLLRVIMLIDSFRTHVLNTNAPMPYVTVTTPKGGFFNFEIFPGVKTHMNTNSLMRFPLMLRNRAADINMEGEVLFEFDTEVPKHPSLIHCFSPGSDIELYSGRLNMYAKHAENLTIYTEANARAMISSPVDKTASPVNGTGSFIVDAATKTITNNGNDTAAAFAWKNRLFLFSKTKLSDVMEQCSNWYNVQFDFKEDSLKAIPITFEFSRRLPLNHLLNELQKKKLARFSWENKQLIIYPPLK